ncbi:CTP synthase [Ureaplasma parvum]|uniref:CTP synthase n=1 Tax=Ureaplasma parvum TaxID=134821 RepID=UPI001152D53A|nr:CTP synthase [Ureaplasma parvum]QDI64274.1 CTP synthase [Ureaplasma parvum]
MKHIQKTKFIFVTGGVYSSLGKGVSASSIGRILVELGYSVAMQKLDPYLNIDPTYLSPLQHGEVFVTKDGKEADLDLGTYERFINADLNKYASVTSGKIYYEILTKERENGFDGKTVQTIPHVTSAVIDYIKKIKDSLKTDFIIVEIGGTIGDIESLPFIEAISQFKTIYGVNNVMFIHCSPLIYIEKVGELKTKPTQHSVKTLRSLGINLDLLLLRTNQKLDEVTIKKLAWSCGLDIDMIFAAYDVESVYLLPNVLFEQGIHKTILDFFSLPLKNDNINSWIDFTDKITTFKKHNLVIGLVGKYVELPDAYKSVLASLELAAIELNIDLKIKYIQPQNLNENNINEELKKINGIVIPSIAGSIKGWPGALLAASYARKNNIPFLAVGTGVNIGIGEFINNVLKLPIEFINLGNGDFSFLKDAFVKNEIENYRIGEYCSNIQANTITSQIYHKQNQLNERHRHHFEFNNHYINNYFLNQNWKIGAISVDNNYIDVLEYTKNHFYVLTIFNPEYTSKPSKANPYFINLLKMSLKIKES